jgi:hypothetical protein
MQNIDGSKWFGQFTISPGRELYGELEFAGPKTALYLEDKADFDAQMRPGRFVFGITRESTKVTLVNCVTTAGLGYGQRGEERYRFAEIFPHYVVHGAHHFDPNEEMVAEAIFLIDDATALFYGFDAFGMVLDARPHIDAIAHANRLDRNIPTGPEPLIAYFTGQKLIFEVNTAIGKISAQHAPSHTIWEGRVEFGLRTPLSSV